MSTGKKNKIALFSLSTILLTTFSAAQDLFGDWGILQDGAQAGAGLLDTLFWFEINTIPQAAMFLAVFAGFYFLSLKFVMTVFDIIDDRLEMGSGGSYSLADGNTDASTIEKGMSAAIAFMVTQYMGMLGLLLWVVIPSVFVAIYFLSTLDLFSTYRNGSPDIGTESVSSSVDNESAERQAQKSGERIEEIEEAATAAENNQIPESEAPEPDDLLVALKNIEKPVKTFEMMIEDSEKDLAKVIRKAKELEEIKKEEKKQFDNILETLKEKEDYLKQLNSDNLEKEDEEKIKKDLMNSADSIETKIEEIEAKQKKYVDMLDKEDQKLMRDIRENEQALKDIEMVTKELSEASVAEKDLAKIIHDAKDYHELEKAEKEIRKLEKSLEQLAKKEEKMVEELEELKQIEEETEYVTEQELKEIRDVIQEDDRIEEYLEKKDHKLAENQKKKVESALEKTKELLKKLGIELKEKEEQKEEEIEEETEEAEKEIEDKESEVEEEINEAEDRTEKSHEEVEREKAESESRAKDRYNTPLIVSMSDIHGHHSVFTNLLNKLDEDKDLPPLNQENYQIVINGDAFDDRDGSEGQSYKVFNKLREMHNNGWNIRYTFGNHDEFILFKEVVMEGRSRRYNDAFWETISEKDRKWFIEQIINQNGFVVGGHEGYKYNYVHAAPAPNFNEALREVAIKVYEVLYGEASINEVAVKNVDYINKGHSLNKEELIEEYFNYLRSEEYKGIFKQSRDNPGAIWTRWDDLVRNNPNGRYIVGHTKKGSCSKGASMFGDGSNPRIARKGSLVNENTIRDGDPALMVETRKDLCALRLDGSKKWLSKLKEE